MSRHVPEPELVALTRELYPRLVGMLTLYLGDRHLAEDLAQETLIRLHEHWPKVRHHPSPTAWASRVAINLAKSWWRRREAERRANRRTSDQPDRHQPDQADELAVVQAVGALPRRQRAVVVLRFYQGLSVCETAAAMSCPEGTVKSLTSQAVAALRRDFTDLTDPRPEPRPDSPSSMEAFHA